MSIQHVHDRTPSPDARHEQAHGDGGAERRSLDSGLTLVHSDYRPPRRLVEPSDKRDAPATLVITMGLAGASGYTGQGGAQLAFRAGYTTIAAFRHGRGERHCEAGARVAQLRLLVDEALLTRYLGRVRSTALLPADGVLPLAFYKTSPAGAARAGALLRCLRYPNGRPLAAHIEALGLLDEQLRLLLPATAPARVDRTGLDAKLDSVLALMESQMGEPLTIAWLCATVGLSETALKQGWRDRFDTTPYRTLLTLRMRRAWTLLEGGCQVAQAGWQVGYPYPGNFSAAFTRFFGRAPKSVGRAPAGRNA